MTTRKTDEEVVEWAASMAHELDEAMFIMQFARAALDLRAAGEAHTSCTLDPLQVEALLAAMVLLKDAVKVKVKD